MLFIDAVILNLLQKHRQNLRQEYQCDSMESLLLFTQLNINCSTKIHRTYPK